MFEASTIPFSIAKLEAQLGRLLSLINGELTQQLLEGLGALIESQTRRRIQTEKTDPNGQAWKPWSPEYAKTRKPRHSLLIDFGNPGLLESIQYLMGDRKVIIGSNMNYAGYNQATRPFLGVGGPGSKPRAEILEAAAAFAKKELFFS